MECLLQYGREDIIDSTGSLRRRPEAQLTTKHDVMLRLCTLAVLVAGIRAEIKSGTSTFQVDDT